MFSITKDPEVEPSTTNQISCPDMRRGSRVHVLPCDSWVSSRLIFELVHRCTFARPIMKYK